jgi:hypothetical protein
MKNERRTRLEREEVQDGAWRSGDAVRPAHLLDESGHDAHGIEVREARYDQPEGTTRRAMDQNNTHTRPRKHGSMAQERWKGTRARDSRDGGVGE